jgi:hypothetical protein
MERGGELYLVRITANLCNGEKMKLYVTSHETIKCHRCSRLFLPSEFQTSGPPESPWQESVPPSLKPAQIIESVITEPYAMVHDAWSTMGTPAYKSLLGLVPPYDIVPQPLTMTVVPGVGSPVGKTAATAFGLLVIASFNFSITISLLLPLYARSPSVLMMLAIWMV